MLVPHSYKYTRSHLGDAHNEKDPRNKLKRVKPERAKTELASGQGRVIKHAPLSLSHSMPATAIAMPSQPLSIPARAVSGSRRHDDQPRTRPQPLTTRSRDHKTVHKRDALPSSVAALLAVTAIPPPRRNQPRRKRADPRRISIDELVQEWRQDALHTSSIGSHKSMDVLLESVDQSADETSSAPEESCILLGSRTTSSDSIPSLEDDDRSVLSHSGPCTPEVTRSGRSSSFGGKKSRPSLPLVEDCGRDHPLTPQPKDHDLDTYDESPLSVQPVDLTRRKSSFKSNLTLSLQALKTRALSSLQQLNLNTTTSSTSNSSPMSSMSDAALWQHPFIFPRLTSELRPSYSGAPSQSQRRYFNPLPLNFDEQQGVYRQALHSTLLLDEDAKAAPMIQMQTYERAARSRKSSRRSNNSKSSSMTEAGRALNGAPLVRQREPRENGDFLRVVVLEMNMRRQGKLENNMGGRARIWLPARRMNGCENDEVEEGRVPRRWIGVTADNN